MANTSPHVRSASALAGSLSLVPFHRRMDETHGPSSLPDCTDRAVVLLDPSAASEQLLAVLRARLHRLDRLVDFLVAIMPAQEGNAEVVDVLETVWPALGELVTLADALADRLDAERRDGASNDATEVRHG